ncbi:energy transducer TonB [Saccharobesus litoralis]|uniref:Energy transducer TonB n=1 Tax=Saccharobesus litoralis TaxID=2172099 RepID=A0A2S0VPR9_9ALTE|nr:energy transducer TonB [Saccharobesus litoralis]AWB66206.1 energy transducer TonB [Saccharobesus litoralis]
MKFIKLTTTLLAISPIAFTFNVLANDDIAKHLYTTEAPKPIKRIHPKYPLGALKQGREGWAVVNFVIDEQGDVSNVVVSKDSGSQDLTDAAVAAIKQWKYKPRVENGKPVQQCANDVLMHFNMQDSEKGVSHRFKGKYQKAVNALAKKDFEQVENILSEMKRNDNQLLSQSAFYHLLAADYAKAQGDIRSQLSHLETVVLSLKNLTNDKQKLSVLYQVLQLQIQQKRYNAANLTYSRLKKLPAAKPYLPKLAKTMQLIDDLIGGEQYISYGATIKPNNLWMVNLVRKQFSLTNVEGGELSSLELRCANKHHIYTATTDSTWTIPNDWKKCKLYVFGEPETTFKITEHPFKA